MQISFKINESMKSILFILKLAGTTKRSELEYIHGKLANMHETLDFLMRDSNYWKYRSMPVLEAIKEAEKEGIDLKQANSPISFLRFVESFDGAPILSTTINTLKSLCIFDKSSTYNFLNRNDISDDLGALHMAGLITKPSIGSLSWNDPEISLTAQGEDAVDRLSSGKMLILRSPGSNQKRIFMACSFGWEDVDDLCESVIKPACQELNANYCRIDITEPITTISEEILNSIRGSSVIVADLTYARPSVYFEAGFALALGIPVLLTCRKDHHRGLEDNQKVHFDLEQFKISFWERNRHGKYSWAKGMKPVGRLEQLLDKCNNALQVEIQNTQPQPSADR